MIQILFLILSKGRERDPTYNEEVTFGKLYVCSSNPKV